MIRTTESDPSIAILKRFFSKVISYKYYYLAFLVVFITVAYFYNKYSHNIYSVNASISPVQNEASSLLSSNDLFRGLGTLQADKNIENEINNLKSFALVSTTISKMNLETSYYIGKYGLLKQTQEIYGFLPFTVTIDKSHLQPIETKFYITVLSDSTFRLTASQDKIYLYNYVDNRIVSENNTLEIDTICKFIETIDNSMFRFSVSINKQNQPASYDQDIFYFFKFHHLDYLAMAYLQRLNIERISPLASIISIEFRGENEQKTIDFLNTFLNSYMDESLAKKNKIAVSTINFIDGLISEISDSLIMSESKLRNYRSANQVMDLSFQGQQLYEQMTQIETDRANLQVQERYYNYILNYLRTNKDVSSVAPPSAMNVNDPILTQLITDLSASYSERSSILSNNSEKNLFLGQIENKIKTQKQSIIENVTNNLNTLSLSLNELNYRANKLNNEISQLPKTELNMVSMQRKFNLNDVIYTYLLQKRSEAAITLASNYPDYEILEPARDVQSIVVAPKRKLNYIIATFLALLIPTLVIIGKDLFNDTITSYHDIERYINRPVFGVIFRNDKKSENIVLNYPGSFIAESFRNLRTNLLLKLKPETSKVILITSTQPGDGKSFVSFNLAASIASVGFKTIIIDCDLRRPTLHAKFQNENSKGLSNYIINNTSPEEISYKTFVENLTFIPAGPLIPKPSELIESGVLDGLINKLKQEYDYVLLDTTPVGLVADASFLLKYATQILLISRNNNTRKDIFANIIDNFNSKKINNFEIVFNDLDFDKSLYKNYSTYYFKS